MSRSRRSLDIRPDPLVLVRKILEDAIPGREVWDFGSRVKGTAKDTSDLDLAVIGDDPLDFRTLGTLRDLFSSSDLPYKVDVLDWSRISPSFREIVRREKIVLCDGQTRPQSGGAAGG